MILPLEKQVSSLESSKRLRELGFSQESLFYWIKCRREIKGVNPWEIKLGLITALLPSSWDYENRISAYTTCEIGKMLPEFIEKEGICYILTINHWSNDGTWQVSYLSGEYNDIALNDFIADDLNEVEARIKMLIYLKENKLI